MREMKREKKKTGYGNDDDVDRMEEKDGRRKKIRKEFKHI